MKISEDDKRILEEALQAIEDGVFRDKEVLKSLTSQIPNLSPEAVEAAWCVMSKKAHAVKNLRSNLHKLEWEAGKLPWKSKND